MNYQPTLPTLIFTTLFLMIYMLVMLKKTIRRKIDLYDLILLSSVAIVPAIFVYFPIVGTVLTQLTGVLFPFILIFGALFLIVFVFIYRSITQQNEIEKKVILLTQEISILKESLSKRKK